MSCLVSYTSGPRSRVVCKGKPPVKPTNWKVIAWFTLPGGVKHTHSADANGIHIGDLGTCMGALIDSLIADHGNAVTGAGWSATTHGRR
jgi:hypothetical protein